MLKICKKMMLVLGVLSFASAAQAGYKYSNLSSPVQIDMTNRYARGAVADARNSPDSKAHLGCFINASPTFTSLQCSATDVSGVTITCNYSNPPSSMIQAVGAINGDSSIYFNWDANLTCGTIMVANESEYRPK